MNDIADRRKLDLSQLPANIIQSIYQQCIVQFPVSRARDTRPDQQLCDALALVDYPSVQANIIERGLASTEVVDYLVEHATTPHIVLALAKYCTKEEHIRLFFDSKSPIVSMAAMYNSNAPSDIQLCRIKYELEKKIGTKKLVDETTET